MSFRFPVVDSKLIAVAPLAQVVLFSRSCITVALRFELVRKLLRVSFQKSFGARANMVYYNRSYGKCHVCQQCTPGTWFRCVICGVWMGELCNPRQVPLATGKDDAVDDCRFEQFEVSLHCHIWTSEIKLRSKRADLCSSCCIWILRELPILAQRRILKYVSYGSWW